MAWIESHQEIRNHPKTRKAAILAKTTRRDIVGALHFLWWWALDYAQDGDLTGFSTEELESEMEWLGDPGQLISALLDCGHNGCSGFIERDIDGRLMIHDWWEYAGRVIERREWDRLRKTLSADILDEQGAFCQLCGATDDLTIDHIMPIRHGGRNRSNNYQVLCRSCNSHKGTREDC